MPCEYATYAKENLIAKKYSGRITRSCVLDMLDRVEADPDYIEGMREFDDLRDVTELDIAPEDIAVFADLIRGMNLRRRQPSRKAVLTSSEETRRAAEAYVAEVEGTAEFEVGVFSDFDEAMAFLGLTGSGRAADLRQRRMSIH